MEPVLQQNILEEHETVVFVRPHAQYPVHGEAGWRWSGDPSDGAFLPEMIRFIELVGRVCYKSEDRITDESASRFVDMLVERGHLSVIEHAALTVKYVGSRAMSHQLVRHRLGSFSQESQRYCNYGRSDKLLAVIPPSVHADAAARKEYIREVESAYAAYLALLGKGIRAEDARHLLPNATKTEIVTTFNLRQWRHAIEERGLNAAAQWEIRRITLAVLDAFRKLLPDIFEDQWVRMNEHNDALSRGIRYADE